jgi:hypothetical protein
MDLFIYFLCFLLSINWIYEILDRPLHVPRHSLVKNIKEETTDDISQATSLTSTKTTTTPVHNQNDSNKYVITFIQFSSRTNNSFTEAFIFRH